MKTHISFAIPVLWLVSFFFSLPLVEPYEVSRLLALGAGVAALAVVLVDPRNRLAELKLTSLAALIGVFLLWCGFSFFWSLSPFMTIISWGTLCLLPLWFLIFSIMPLTQDQIMMALRLAVAATTLLALWALTQFFLLPQFLDANGTIRYPFADPNNYVGLLNMGLFTALGLLFTPQSKPTRNLYMLACLLMMGALMLMGSRMGIILSFAMLPLFFVFVRKVAGVSGRNILLIASIGILAFAGSGLFNTTRVTSIERAADLVSITDDKSVSARMDILDATFDLIGERPFLGSGLGTYFLMYPAVRNPSEVYSSGLMAHADPLQFWAEAGLPSVVLVYAILIVVLLGFIKFLKQTKAHDPARCLPVALFCALLTLALHMHVTFHLYVASLLTVAGLLLGIFTHYLPVGRVWLTCRVGAPAITTLMLLLAFLVVFQTCLFSEMHTRQGVELMNGGDMQGFGDKINQAHREGFGLNPRPYILAASIPLGILQTSPRLAAEEREALFKQTDQMLDQGLALSPANAGAYFSKALLYGAMGRKEDAVGFLEQTLKIDPRHAQAKAMLGR